MSLILLEMNAAMARIRDDQLKPAFKIICRISRIQQQIANVWDVVTTLTPSDYLSFRESLGQASGFQSYQYRMSELTMGNKNSQLAEVFSYDPDLYGKVQDALNAPSVYEESLKPLARRGFDLPSEILERNWSKPYQADGSVLAAWQMIYRNTEEQWDLYELAEKLVDMEDQFQRWRFRHFKSVERLIGNRMGTGGTTGATYLEKAC